MFTNSAWSASSLVNNRIKNLKLIYERGFFFLSQYQKDLMSICLQESVFPHLAPAHLDGNFISMQAIFLLWGKKYLNSSSHINLILWDLRKIDVCSDHSCQVLQRGDGWPATRPSKEGYPPQITTDHQIFLELNLESENLRPREAGVLWREVYRAHCSDGPVADDNPQIRSRWSFTSLCAVFFFFFLNQPFQLWHYQCSDILFCSIFYNNLTFLFFQGWDVVLVFWCFDKWQLWWMLKIPNKVENTKASNNL